MRDAPKHSEKLCRKIDAVSDIGKEITKVIILHLNMVYTFKISDLFNKC
jgi:hypothetical protein